MYNENQKKRYIKFKKSTTILSENFLETQFKLSESYEEEIGKDLCNFNEDEIKEFYKTRNLKAVETIYNMNSQFKEYTNWCNAEGLVKDHQNHYSFLSSNELKSCANIARMKAGYVTREELLKAINKLENPCDRYMFLAAFEGIKGKNFSDLVNVTCKDLDGNMLKLQSGKELWISDELKKLIETSCNTYVYQSKQKELKLTGEKVIKERANTMNITAFAIGRRAYSAFKRLKDEIGLEYATYNSIYTSGKFSYTMELYYMERMKNNELQLIEFVKEHREIIEEKYDKIFNIKGYIEAMEGYLM